MVQSTPIVVANMRRATGKGVHKVGNEGCNTTLTCLSINVIYSDIPPYRQIF